MSPEMEGQGFPSKVYTIMACAKPLLVISGKGTPIYNFLEKANCAFLVDTKVFDEKCELIVRKLKEALMDRVSIRKLGENGFKLIEQQYSKEAVTQQYVALADQILKR
ncbi:hypothetical protein D3C80_1860110 [compost metagenome]